MAHILMIDDGEVACLALRGILAERGHRTTIAATVAQAWRTLHELDDLDLAIVELKLKTESALPFLQRVRGIGMFKALPVLVYTSVSEVSVVRSVLALRPQNYLLKPYRSELVHHEVEKALAAPWRDALIDENSFALQAGRAVAELKNQRSALAAMLDEAGGHVAESLSGGAALRLLPRLKTLVENAAGVGAPGIASYLEELIAEAGTEHWWSLKESAPTLGYAARLLRGGATPAPAIDTAATLKEEIPRDRIFWEAAEAANRFPLDRKVTEAEVDALAGCPVIDTVAAAFAMATEGSHSNLNHLNDLVAQDAGLAVTVLMAANHLAREGDLNAIEATGTAVSMLGDVKLAALTRSVPQVSEASLRVPPLAWAQYRRFQRGVARMSEFVRRALEFKELEAVAATAGLVHDAGQMLLMRVYPHGFKRMIEHAALHGISIDHAQRRFLGVSARELAAGFFARGGLPSFYCSVIQHVHAPADAPPADADLVAVVSLARHLCLQNELGCSCDPAARRHLPPLEESAAWQRLSQRVFPSFHLHSFEKRAAEHCENLKHHLITDGFSSESS